MFSPIRFHFGKMLFLLVCLCTSAILSAANPWVARHNLSAAQYQQFYNTYTQQGYRPKQVSCYSAGNSIFYAALFEKVAGPALVTHHGMSAADYQQKFTTYAQQGYRLTWVDGCGLNGAAFYSAIWEKNATIQIARHGMSPTQYQQEYTTQSQNGYRIKQVEGFGEAMRSSSSPYGKNDWPCADCPPQPDCGTVPARVQHQYPKWLPPYPCQRLQPGCHGLLRLYI